MRPIVLVGGGGQCKSVIDIIETAGLKIRGILDLPNNIGNKILGYTIIESDTYIPQLVSENVFLITVGHIRDASIRIEIFEKISSVGGELMTLISPLAHVSKYAKIGAGSIIHHHAVVNADSVIGENCIINTFADIEHDVIIGDFCHISTGAIINGNCQIGTGTFIGSQAVIVDGVSVSNKCLIGAGAVVQKDIVKCGIYFGNPAVFRKDV
jgi:sugar O-acyltransferase (sialic acid O-acetyltransferase NeuD family)